MSMCIVYPCALRVQVLRLVGRTLAKLLILGDGYHVSDRLPSFVLQLLTTDNCLLTDDEVVSKLDSRRRRVVSKLDSTCESN